ncbi:MAG: hypothetical protein WAU86_00300, partial [Oricola sp.]
ISRPTPAPNTVFGVPCGAGQKAASGARAFPVKQFQFLATCSRGGCEKIELLIEKTAKFRFA